MNQLSQNLQRIIEELKAYQNALATCVSDAREKQKGLEIEKDPNRQYILLVGRPQGFHISFQSRWNRSLRAKLHELDTECYASGFPTNFVNRFNKLSLNTPKKALIYPGMPLIETYEAPYGVNSQFEPAIFPEVTAKIQAKNDEYYARLEEDVETLSYFLQPVFVDLSTKGSAESVMTISLSPSSDVSKLFAKVSELFSQEMANQDIDTKILEIASNDLNQAILAFQGQAYKSCVIMLGAVLEGVMLWKILSPSVMTEVKTSVVNKEGRFLDIENNTKRYGGAHDAHFEENIAIKGSYETYKNVINALIPGVKTGIKTIQDFRNAIHPNKLLRNPEYDDFSQERAIEFTAAAVSIIKKIVAY